MAPHASFEALTRCMHRTHTCMRCMRFVRCVQRTQRSACNARARGPSGAPRVARFQGGAQHRGALAARRPAARRAARVVARAARCALSGGGRRGRRRGGGGRLGRDDVRVAAPAREGGGDGPPRTSGFGSSGVIRSAPMCAAVASAHSVGFAATRRRIVLVLTSGGAEEARGVEGGGGRRGGVSRHGWGRGEAQNAATGSGVGVIAPWNARPQLDIIATLVADTWACFSPLLWSAPAGSTHGQHPCARR